MTTVTISGYSETAEAEWDATFYRTEIPSTPGSHVCGIPPSPGHSEYELMVLCVNCEEIVPDEAWLNEHADDWGERLAAA